tara:strand:- start:15654 stop:16082 length:429 start_codon:yes stop_codon:yes gene_type:complete
MNIDILDNLPHEILDIIFMYLKPANLIFLNKYYYEKYNFMIEKIFFKGEIQRYHSYIRDIVREDAIFVFKYITKNKFNTWLLNTNFKYKNVIYINYINYLIHLATIYNSNKCCELLKYNLSLTGLSKISLKNNKIKYNKWIN